MKVRLVFAVLVAAVATSLVALPGAIAAPPAQAAAPTVAGVNVPINFTNALGGFAGNYNITSFALQNGQLVAIGTLTGTLTNAAGGRRRHVTTCRSRFPCIGRQATARARSSIWSLGPLDLNLLGLVVHLNTVHLNITAVPGPGNLLGNLLCAVAGLLDNTGGGTAGGAFERDRGTAQQHPAEPVGGIIHGGGRRSGALRHLRAELRRLGDRRLAGEALADVDGRLAVDEPFPASSGTSSAGPNATTRVRVRTRAAPLARPRSPGGPTIAISRARREVEVERARAPSRTPTARAARASREQPKHPTAPPLELVVAVDPRRGAAGRRRASSSRSASGGRRAPSCARRARSPSARRLEEAAALVVAEQLDREPRRAGAPPRASAARRWRRAARSRPFATSA